MKIASFNVLAQPLDKEGQAQAAQTFADTHSLWVKFIFTDDKPNANNQAIAQTEYASIMNTGVHKPFKKATGALLSDDHNPVIPIGTIVEMAQETNTIVGLAAVWEPEFPEEAASIREAHANGESLDVSWELFYEDSKFDDDTGVEWLQGVSTRAVALVGQPAYDGRTPVLAVATKQDKEGDKNMELEQALARVKELEADKARLELGLDETKTSLTETKASLDELLELKTEVETLREFKIKVEEAETRSALVSARMKQFSEAGIEMTDEEFEAAADKWLSMDDDAFTFILTQLVGQKPEAGSQASLDAGASVNSNGSNDPKSLVKEFLAARKENSEKPEEK